MVMRNILLTIEYDGSGFHGWQEQPNVRTVQGELQRALGIVLAEEVQVAGTSRTDAGVHALGQCCSFETENPIPVENLKKAANNALSEGKAGAGAIPGDIKILDCKEVPEGFHARFDCKGKTYGYLINTGEPDVFRRKYCYFVDGRLDVDAMNAAKEHILGTHDFACFQSAGGTLRETTVRTISDLTIENQGDDYMIRVTGDGFLYNMVRIIVGTLVEVGLGKKTPDSVKDAIDGKDRSLAGHTAPAEGLYLEKIYFVMD